MPPWRVWVVCASSCLLLIHPQSSLAYGGGFTLTELPEDVLDEEELGDKPSTLESMNAESVTSIDSNIHPVQFRSTPGDNRKNLSRERGQLSAKLPSRPAQCRASGYSNPLHSSARKRLSTWRAGHGNAIHALAPSLIALATGLAVSGIRRSIWPNLRRVWRRRCLSRSLLQEQKKQEALLQGAGGGEGHAWGARFRRGREGRQAADLEKQVEILRGEVAEQTDHLTRLQTSKLEELTNAKTVIEQLRQELETVRTSKEHLRTQHDDLKRDYQLRTQSLQLEAERHKGLTENQEKRIRAMVEAELTQKHQELLSQERELLRKLVRQQSSQEVDGILRQGRDKYEKEIMALYNRRLAEEVAKCESDFEDRLRAQETEYRRQCEELRSKMQIIMRHRQDSMKQKVALHARELQDKLRKNVVNPAARPSYEQQPAYTARQRQSRALPPQTYGRTAAAAPDHVQRERRSESLGTSSTESAVAPKEELVVRNASGEGRSRRAFSSRA